MLFSGWAVSQVQYTHLQVDGVPVERYLTAFQWDEAKHPVRRPLKETVENIQAGIVTTEENLKARAPFEDMFFVPIQTRFVLRVNHDNHLQ